jgi:hypothetical protein
MNLENLATLITSIEESETFNMSRYFHNDGAPGCITGHAVCLQVAGESLHLRDIDYVAEAARYLDISALETSELSEGWISDVLDKPTSKDAVELLKRMLFENRAITWNEFLGDKNAIR